MAAKLLDRVKMSVSAAPGTGPITLGFAAAKYQSVTDAGGVNGDTVNYLIDDGAAWETGVGTYNAGVISRDTVRGSSAAGAKINATVNAIIFITVLSSEIQSGTGANQLVRLDGSAKLPPVDGSQLTNLPYVPITSANGAAGLPTGTTAQRPTGAAGQLRYNSTTGKFEGFSAAWGNIGGGAAISDNAPANPGAGDLWWNSTDGNLYVFYDDGNTAQWVDVTGVGNNIGVPDGSITPAKLAQPLTLMTAKNSTSGTSIDFTSIPSWVKRVTVMFSGVSTNGAANILVQLGAGSIVSSGYVSTSTLIFGGSLSFTSSTAGVVVFNNSSGYIHYGSITFNLVGANTWVAAGLITNATNYTAQIAGGVTLSGALDRLRITTANGTDAFDAGSVNVLYE